MGIEYFKIHCLSFNDDQPSTIKPYTNNEQRSTINEQRSTHNPHCLFPPAKHNGNISANKILFGFCIYQLLNFFTVKFSCHPHFYRT